MKTQGRVLIVDDEPDMRYILQGFLETKGFEVCAVPDGSAAIGLIGQRAFDVVIVDLLMPGISGIETVRHLKKLRSDTQIIILTGSPSLDTAISSVREGVLDYLLKPSDMWRLGEVVSAGVQKARQLSRRRGSTGRTPSPSSLPPHGEWVGSPLVAGDECKWTLVGTSAAMSKVRTLIAKVGPTDLTVLVRGETGTGKEVVARHIHACSGRDSHGSFTRVNCAAIPDHLLESEMFGYEKGAFTGAEVQKVGRFELAAGGTVLLDEIGAVALGSQSKLLEAIEHKEFVRLGGRDKTVVDARILAATSAPLEVMIEKEQFRPDLFFRLQSFTIVIPPLRDHKEDIPDLTRHFLKRYSARFRKDIADLPSSLMLRLGQYDWPGNIRQLDTVIAHYCVTGDLGVIDEALGLAARDPSASCPKDFLQECERNAVKFALEQARGNQRRAASLLGLNYGAFRRRILKYKLLADGK